MTTQHRDVAICVFERDTERETDKERDIDELTNKEKVSRRMGDT